MLTEAVEASPRSPRQILTLPPWRILSGRLGLLLTASYGLLYFSYKFLMPWGGTGDFDRYYPMDRSPLNFHVAPAPFVLRQVSAVLTYLTWKAHIFYPSRIAFRDPAYDQRIFFAALFVNWICLVLAAVTAGLIAEEMLGRRAASAAHLAGLLCLLSFHVQSVVLSGLAEGPGWLLLALGFLACLRRAPALLACILALAVFERETVLLALGILSAGDAWRHRHRSGEADQAQRFRMQALFASLLGLALYVALRHMLPGYENQTSPAGLFHGLRETRFNGDLLFQGLLTQNVVLIALAAWWNGRDPATRRMPWLLPLLATLGLLDAVGLAAGVSNNIGRIGGILTPCFAAIAAACLLDADASGHPSTVSTGESSLSQAPPGIV